jgi:hypothetical protein
MNKDLKKLEIILVTLEYISNLKEYYNISGIIALANGNNYLHNFYSDSKASTDDLISYYKRLATIHLSEILDPIK